LGAVITDLLVRQDHGLVASMKGGAVECRNAGLLGRPACAPAASMKGDAVERRDTPYDQPGSVEIQPQ
jgi:hypothetical protein